MLRNPKTECVTRTDTRVSRPRLLWTPQMVADFWDYQSSRRDAHTSYFSKQLGRGLVAFARDHCREFGEVADFGAGRGHLLEYLLEQGHRCWALDYSEAMLTVLSGRLSTLGGFAGTAQVDLHRSPTVKVDTVFCVEVLEHVLPEDLPRTLEFLHKLVRMGGNLVVTVPHDEDLAEKEVFCPNCRSVFHRVQHVSSWTPAKLDRLLVESGFSTTFCGPVDLKIMQRRETAAQAWWLRRVWYSCLRIIDLRGHAEASWSALKLMWHSMRGSSRPKALPQLPHLIYIGRRKH